MLSKGLVFAIRLYQRCVSPFFPPSCRFVPTCSEYAVEAIVERGGLIGSWLALRRLVRCWPFVRGGLDPVPEVGVSKSRAPKLPAARHCKPGTETTGPGLAPLARQKRGGGDAG